MGSLFDNIFGGVGKDINQAFDINQDVNTVKSTSTKQAEIGAAELGAEAATVGLAAYLTPAAAGGDVATAAPTAASATPAPTDPATPIPGNDTANMTTVNVPPPPPSPVGMTVDGSGNVVGSAYNQPPIDANVLSSSGAGGTTANTNYLTGANTVLKGAAKGLGTASTVSNNIEQANLLKERQEQMQALANTSTTAIKSISASPLQSPSIASPNPTTPSIYNSIFSSAPVQSSFSYNKKSPFDFLAPPPPITSDRKNKKDVVKADRSLKTFLSLIGK